MSSVGLLLLLICGQDAAKPPSLEAQFQAIDLADARKWDMFLDAAQQTKASLLEKPVYLWTNPTKNKGQYGSVFVWTHQDRPVVVGSIFVDCTIKTQRLVHEFAVLSPETLHPRCLDCEGQQWEPKAGLILKPLPGTSPPDALATKRLLQFRAIARDFSGHTFDNYRKLRWELRCLPQPWYRFQNPQAGIIDGGVFGLITDAGTDPEVLLLLEARREGGWHYGLIRFGDASMYVNHQSQEVWSAVRGPEEQQFHNADHTYQALLMRFLGPTEVVDLAQTP